MEDIRKKKEFIYYLGNDYYLIGTYACEKCTDADLISKYKDYLDVCDCEAFNSCKCLEDVRKIPSYTRNVIANAYEIIATECRMVCEKDRIDENALALLDRLEERYQEEIQEQIHRWLLAFRCVDYRNVEKRKEI